MTLQLTNGSDITSLLKEVAEKPDIHSVTFQQVVFDQDVSAALLHLMGNSEGRKWRHVMLENCTGQIEIPISTFMLGKNLRKFTFRNFSREASLAVNAALSFASSLTQLRIQARFSPENCQALADALSGNTKLQELDLRMSHFDADAVKLLAEGLSKNRQLKVLSLNSCNLTDGCIGDLVEGLSQNESLEELDLGYNQCCTAAHVWVTYLLQASTCKLTKLSLEHQDLGDQILNISPISNALRTNNRLQYLDLSGNKLDNEDMAQLASALKVNKTVETVHLWSNKMTDSGALSFAEQIPDMHGLRKVYFGDNPFGREGSRYLMQALQLNDAIQYVGFPTFTWLREVPL